MTTKKTSTEKAPVKPEIPTQGGSYSRDPETGKLTLIQRTEAKKNTSEGK